MGEEDREGQVWPAGGQTAKARDGDVEAVVVARIAPRHNAIGGHDQRPAGLEKLADMVGRDAAGLARQVGGNDRYRAAIECVSRLRAISELTAMTSSNRRSAHRVSRPVSGAARCRSYPPAVDGRKVRRLTLPAARQRSCDQRRESRMVVVDDRGGPPAKRQPVSNRVAVERPHHSRVITHVTEVVQDANT